MTNRFTKGDWTNCRYDICEIEKDNEVFCTVATDDVDLIIKVLNENEQLKSKNRGLQSELQIFKEDVTHSNLQINKLADENEQLKLTNKYLIELLEHNGATVEIEKIER